MTERELVQRAQSLPDAADRARFLLEHCGDDAALRERIERLLAAPSGTATFDPAAPVSTADYLPTDGPGLLLAGKYKLIQQIGEGGMGTVWMAQQTEPVRRLVAVKVIKAGMDSKAVLARFEAERQALAMMDHPNIARVFDAGVVGSHESGPLDSATLPTAGRPFFVMELVRGVPITKFCDERKLTPRERLELFVPVCQAIQHAHQKGVIHRDIKPNNLMVALYDDRPVPKVIDFGVAKATGAQLTEQTLVTGFGAVVGTPEYMSPEQASFNQLDVDTRSDVYTLGVVLYELLTGATPIDRKSLGPIELLDLLRFVREVDPPRPSTKVTSAAAKATVAAARGTEPSKLAKLLRGELDWIVMKALDKDRTRRYETASSFAADVQRYLAGETVLAVPPSAGYRLRKFVRKHKGRVAAGTAVAAALAGGLVGTTWQAIRAEQEADRVRAEEQKTRDALGIAERNRELSEKHLVRSYLRPLGYNEKPEQYDPAELYALSELSELSGSHLQASTTSGDTHGDMIERAEQVEDRLKLLCLTEALSNPETALRTARRTERFVQAVVGSSLPRRQQVLELVAAKQRDTTVDIRVRLAACWMAMELGSDDLPALGDSLNYLAEREKTDWSNFVEVLSRARLTPEQAALSVGILSLASPEVITGGYYPMTKDWKRTIAKLTAATTAPIAATFIDVIDQSANDDVRTNTANTLAVIAPYLGPAASPKVRNPVAERIVAATGETDDGYALMNLAKGLAAVAPHLEPTTAQRACLSAAEALSAALRVKTDDDDEVAALTAGLRALAPRLAAADLERLAQSLPRVNLKTARMYELQAAAHGHTALAPWLAPAVARKCGTQIADAVMVLLPNGSDAFALMAVARTLAAVAPHLEPATVQKCFTQTADAIVAMIPTTTQPRALWPLILGFDELAPQFAPALAAKYEGRIAAALTEVIAGTTESDRLEPASRTLVRLAPRLDPAAVPRLAETLAGVIAEATNRSKLHTATAALVALAPRLDSATAQRIANTLVAANLTTTDDDQLESLAESLAALAPRIKSATQTKFTARVAEVLVAKLGLPTESTQARSVATGQVTVAPRPDAQRLANSRVAPPRTIDRPQLQAASAALVSVAPRLDAATRAKTVEAIMALLAKTTDEDQVQWCLETLAVLDPARHAAESPHLIQVGLHLVFQGAARSNSFSHPAYEFFLRNTTDWRLLAELLAHPGCVRLPREYLVKRLEELLIRPPNTEPHAAVIGCAVEAIIDERVREQGQRFRTVWDAAEHLAKHHPDFALGKLPPSSRRK